MHKFLGYLPTQYPIDLKKFSNAILFEKEIEYYEIIEISLTEKSVTVIFQYSNTYIDEWKNRWTNLSDISQSEKELRKHHGFTLDVNGIITFVTDTSLDYIVEIGKHHAKFARRVLRILELDNAIALAPGHKHGLFLHILLKKTRPWNYWHKKYRIC